MSILHGGGTREDGKEAHEDRSEDRGRLYSGEVFLRFVPLSLVLLVAGICAYFLARNLFGFPHYENDEGTYMGSAWAMFTQGKLSYYTYTYDHPVLGWTLLGLWTLLTGGFDAFGNSINTGRVMMVGVGVVSAVMIFEILRRSTGRILIALPAALLFIVSPLGVSLHRQVWIDNIATMWLLGAILSLVAGRGRLGFAVLSAVLFGLSFWSKEVFAVFLPAMIYLAYVHAHPGHRRFALALWGTLSVAVISLFVLLATLKDELLPPGVLWSSPEPHVSLLQTLGNQAARGENDGLMNPSGQFWTFFGQWRFNDPILIAGGVATALIGLLFFRRDRMLFGVSLMTVLFFLFLGRGGVVLYYYVIPLLALFTLTIGLFASNVVNLLIRFRVPGWAAAGLLTVVSAFVLVNGFQGNTENFNRDSTSSQNEAAAWISDNLPEDSTIISDAFLWSDLRNPDFTGGKVFDSAHYYFPALSDDTVREGELNDDWRNVDYIAVSPTTEADIERDFVPLLPDAARNADLVRSFNSGDWRVQIMRVRKLDRVPATADPVLVSSWDTYKSRFVRAEGRVVNPEGGGSRTTPEQQADTMRQAVYMDDRATFDSVWNWTRENEQRPDGRLSETADPAANTDAALSLLLAAEKWNDPAYEGAALDILDGIWTSETVETPLGRVVVSEYDPAFGTAMIETNAFAPHAYRIFEEADPSRPWGELAESTYNVLGAVSRTPGMGAEEGLYPEEVSVGLDGSVYAAPDAPATTGEDGLVENLSLDYLWFRDDRAREALRVISRPEREMGDQSLIFSGYNLDGSVRDDSESVDTYSAAAVNFLLTGEGTESGEVFASEVVGTFDSGGGTPGRAHWGDDPDDLKTQQDAWFATALMDGSLANLYAGDETILWRDIDTFENLQHSE